jgi:hypothetical protein
MSVHHVDVQYTCAATFDGFDLISQTGKVCRKDRGRNINGSVLHLSVLPISDCRLPIY